MRINYKKYIYKSVRIICILLFIISITIDLSAQRESKEKVSAVNITLRIVDNTGLPIPKANVVIGEGRVQSISDEKGLCIFNANPSDVIVITAHGFERSVFIAQEIFKENEIILNRSKLYMSSDDNIPLPYMTLKKRFITGSYNVLNGDQLEKYPSLDLRNSFTGLNSGLQITEFDGSTGISAEETLGSYGITKKVGIYSRGRNIVFIIDNVPIDITEMTLDPQEIESVTIIKDIVGKAMYGPIGADGIIYIKTKRGKAFERILNVDAEYGIGMIDRFPEWVSGSDYAMLNNQARLNDGLQPKYTTSDIAAYEKKDPYDMFHPSIDFKGMMLKNTKSLQRVNVSSSGGSDKVQYFAYLGYSGEGDIFKLGSIADYNRINTRSNIDINLNEFFDLQLDIAAAINIRRSPNYGYTATSGETGTQMDMLEFNSVVDDITTIPPIAFPVYANNDPELKSPWFGVSSIYKFNPIGNITENGHYSEIGRKASSKLALTYNFRNFIPGLKSQTALNFDALNLLRKGKATDYNAYIATPLQGTIKLTKVHDGLDNPSILNLHDYYYLIYSISETLNYEKKFGNHDLQSSLTYFMYKMAPDGIRHPQREQLSVFTGNYTFNEKYALQVLLNYAGTSSFAENKRYRLFPSIGAAWIISDESFMMNMEFINFLKFRFEAGILGYESWLTPHYNLDNFTSNTGANFGPYTTNTWFGTSPDDKPYRAYPSRIGNPDLSWEKRKEVSIGMDALMFNNKLLFELSYFNNLRDGIIVQVANAMPYITGYSAALPWFNYNSIRYFGLESEIKYTSNKGAFGYSFGTNITIQNSKIEKYDEPAYRFTYQTRIGKPADSYWGQICLGKFSSDTETLEIPQLFDEVLKKGDLKYKDMNSDGVIDDNDESVIGHTSPRLYYALNCRLNYKNFDLTLIGTGCAFFDLPLTNKYFWNGWGDNTYSKFVSENIEGDYPRLTYYKVNNNFVRSDFWLVRGDYFKIQNLEFAYTFDANKMNFIQAQRLRLFIRGANLLTISKVKDVDPESINSGVTVYPLYRTVSGGIKLTF